MTIAPLLLRTAYSCMHLLRNASPFARFGTALCALGVLLGLSRPVLAVAPPVPAASWLLDDASGSKAAALHGGASLDGTVSAGASWNSTGSLSYAGNGSLNANGVSGRITVEDNVLLNPGSLSFSVWIKTLATTESNDYGILQKAASGTGGWMLFVRQGKASITVRDSAGISHTIESSTLVNDDVWHLVVGTFDASRSTLSIYVDGVLQSTLAGASLAHNTQPLHIGGGDAGDGGSGYFPGQIDEPALYDRALQDDEVAYLHAHSLRPIFPEDFGAVGDGSVDDTSAFQKAAAALKAAGGGTFSLTPNRTYRVGRQVHKDGVSPFYQYEDIFHVDNADQTITGKIAVIGKSSTLKINDGLRYGSFDPDTGQPYHPVMPFVDRNYAAAIGYMLFFNRCPDVEIRDIHLHGNRYNLVYGGYWGDAGRQLRAYGVALFSNEHVELVNVDSQYSALDGVGIAHALTQADAPKPHHLKNVTCFHNGRNGLSVVGSNALTAEDCKFNYNGGGGDASDGFSSPPRAGVDLEGEWSIVQNSVFNRCDFVGNGSAQMVSDRNALVADAQFKQCLFWSTTSAAFVWPNNPGFKFTDSTIRSTVIYPYASDDPNKAAQFVNCTMEAPSSAQYEDATGTHVYSTALYAGTLFYGSSGQVTTNVLLDGCTLISHHETPLFFYNGGPVGQRAIIKNTSIYQDAPSPMAGEYWNLLRGVTLENTHFVSTAPGSDSQALPRKVLVRGVTVGNNVTVEGNVIWSPGEQRGLIPPGEH